MRSSHEDAWTADNIISMEAAADDMADVAAEIARLELEVAQVVLPHECFALAASLPLTAMFPLRSASGTRKRV